MNQQQDLRLFIEQLETVAAHCDDTNMRAGAATVREAIERLSRATPTPDAAGLVEEAKRFVGSATPAPWRNEGNFVADENTIVVGDEAYDWRFVAHTNSDLNEPDSTHHPRTPIISKEQAKANAEFIAFARNNMDNFITTVESLSQERATLAEALDAFTEPMRRYRKHTTWLVGDENLLFEADDKRRKALALIEGKEV